MNYVGIDLGTTNSAICSYDGESVRLYKSPEQHDVTPSAIFIDRRGNKYLGTRAYNNAARSPDSAAILFKRLMGTSTPIPLPAVDVTLTPEECSAEILRLLHGYLPEALRQDGETGTVITVPAAFNQMQKDATLSAARAAGIGRVALMQEPVAAVMSVMRQRDTDGIFLVYDLGGGTLDIAIAESIAGRVSLLAHGGIAMCGGRDFDRLLFDNVVKAWLCEHFRLPENLSSSEEYGPLVRLGQWATEKAKIELSQRETTAVSVSEPELGMRDLNGEELYLDVPLEREQLNSLIEPRIEETIDAARDTLKKAGLRPDDVERIAFIGGPTHYQPLRDKVAFELGIAASDDLNPMTAVAEGAAVFAESIDWSSESHGRKGTQGALEATAPTGPLHVRFDYISRTPDNKAKLVVKVETHQGYEFQIDSLDTGWSSGRMILESGATVDLPLMKPGPNSFKIFVFDRTGAPVDLEDDKVRISRTAASVDAIPASHSIAVEARDTIGGQPSLELLVREGEQLPKKGEKVFKAEEAIRAGSAESLRFKLWEGEIADPITDNRFIGVFEIRGTDFDEGVIPAGSELVCSYEIRDSGNIMMEVSVPSIAGSFHSGRNFYSRQAGSIDYSKASRLIREEVEAVSERIQTIEENLSDPKLENARRRLDRAAAGNAEEKDAEMAKQALDDVQEAKKLLAQTRKEHLRTIRQLELDRTGAFFDQAIREHARPSEVTAYENLLKTAQRAIDGNTREFEGHLSDLRMRNFMILWRQDWFVIDRFKWLADSPHLFPDEKIHSELVKKGGGALRQNDVDTLREVVATLDSNRVGTGGGEDMLTAPNIIRG